MTDVLETQVQEMLGHIEKGNLLPPMVVLQTLARNPHLKLAVVKEYMSRQLKAESSHIEEDRRQIAKYKKEAAEARKEAEELTTKVRPALSLPSQLRLPPPPPPPPSLFDIAISRKKVRC